MGAVTAIMLFVSVLLHELGHSVVAMRYKVPVRSITLHIFGGYPNWHRTTDRRSRILDCHRRSFYQFRFGSPLQSNAAFLRRRCPLLGLSKYLAYINVALGLFNLVPGFPWTEGVSYEPSSGVSPMTCAGQHSSPQCGAIHRLPLHLLRCVANLWRQLH